MAAIAAVLLPTSVSAQSYEDTMKGLYVDLRGGLTSLSDSDLTDPALPGISGEAEFDNGFGIEGAVGYEHPSGFRVELALGYRNNDFDDVSVAGISASSAGVNVGGQVEALSVMANGYAAFDVGGGFKPFIGAGVGVAFLDAELELSVPGFAVTASDDDTVFAYQGIAGVEYEIPTDMATIALGVRYSYFATADPDFGGTEAEYGTHNVMVGVRISR
jgi:opacity protein-like surface antigen